MQDELYSSLALLILVTLLIGTLWTSYYLQLKKIRAVHETVVSIFGGLSRRFELTKRNDCGIDYPPKSEDGDTEYGFVQVFCLLQFATASDYSEFWL